MPRILFQIDLDFNSHIMSWIVKFSSPWTMVAILGAQTKPAAASSKTNILGDCRRKTSKSWDETWTLRVAFLCIIVDDFLHPGNLTAETWTWLVDKTKSIWTKPSLFKMLIFRGVAVMFLILTAVPPVVQFSHPVWTSPKLRMLRGFVILCRCDGHILKTWSKPPWKRSPGMSKQTANFRPFSWSLLRVMEVDLWFRMDFLAKATCEHLIQGRVDGISILKPLWSHIINISSRWSDAYNLSGKKYEKLFEGLGNCTKNSGEASKRYGGRTYTHPFFARIRWFHQPFFGYFFLFTFFSIFFWQLLLFVLLKLESDRQSLSTF